MSRLEVLLEEDGVLFGRMGPLAVLVWFQTPTVRWVEHVAELLPQIAYGGEFAMLTVVTPACVPVGPEVRSSFDQGVRPYHDQMMGIATVIQVPGVLGGLTRAIARTMSIISRVSYPNNVYASVADAAEWLPRLLASCTPPPPTTEQIIDELGPRLAPS